MAETAQSAVNTDPEGGTRRATHPTPAYFRWFSMNEMLECRIIAARAKTYLRAIANDTRCTERGLTRVGPITRRETMKTMLLAAAAALSLGIGSAYAADGQGPAGGYVYPGYIAPGAVYAGAQTAVQNAPSVVATQTGQGHTHAYVTRSQSQGVWLFPPNEVGGGGNS
jgi:hypothetical protein